MDKKEKAKIKRIIAAYNMIPNLFWSAVFLFPLAVFCYKYMSIRLLVVFLAISLLTVFLPRSFFNFFQSTKMALVYKKSGVGFVNRFTQNGVIIHKLIRKKYSEFKNKLSIPQLLQQTYLFEKFHFMLFSFFMLTDFYALFRSFYGWTFFIFISNLIYNIYPILLQQSIRIRLLSLKKYKTVTRQ